METQEKYHRKELEEHWLAYRDALGKYRQRRRVSLFGYMVLYERPDPIKQQIDSLPVELEKRKCKVWWLEKLNTSS